MPPAGCGSGGPNWPPRSRARGGTPTVGGAWRVTRLVRGGRQMAKPYDASLKHLVDSRPTDWLELAGLPRGQSARMVDADLSAVTAAADKVVLVEGDAP